MSKKMMLRRFALVSGLAISEAYSTKLSPDLPRRMS